MNRLEAIRSVREKLANNKVSLGSWLQIASTSTAEILGQAGYDWIAVDMEHGSISTCQLPDLFRALELGGTLPLVRLAQGDKKDCKQALDAGAGGVIVPMIESAAQLISIRDACRWPPSGVRGVAFSRANLFGKYFEQYREEAQAPLLIAMIESKQAVDNLEEILRVDGLDAILIGPYDLSASMGITAQFSHFEFVATMTRIRDLCKTAEKRSGVHVVQPDIKLLAGYVEDGYRFIAYSIDSVFFNDAVLAPKLGG